MNPQSLRLEAEQGHGHHGSTGEQEKHGRPIGRSILDVPQGPAEAVVLRVAERLFDLHPERVGSHDALGCGVGEGGGEESWISSLGAAVKR